MAGSDETGFAGVFRPDLPPPAPRFVGLPRYNFVWGHNDPTQVPAGELADAASSVLRRSGRLLGMYNLGQAPQGFEGLRAFVAGKLGQRSGIRCTADDVLITSGSLQALDLVNAIFLAPGDTVILEEFTYGGAIAKVQKLGATVVGAPLDGGGLRMTDLRAILTDLRNRSVRPKYIYTIPTVQNPTGTILPLERRHELIALSREFGVPIFEDECYADLVWSGERPPALYALDPSRVVHVGSFSKSLAPALRIGYVVADWSVLGRVLAIKTDAGTGALEQMVAAEYCTRQFDSHVGELTAALLKKRDALIDALAQEFGASVEIFVPQGGIFLWLKLPDSIDVRRLVQPAADAGVAFNPGPEWACDAEAAKSHMRLCFALPTTDDIRAGVAELARVCFEETGVPERGANNLRTVTRPQPAA